MYFRNAVILPVFLQIEQIARWMFFQSAELLKIRLVELNFLPACHGSVIRKELDTNAIRQEAFFFLQSFKVLAVVFCEAPFLRDEDLLRRKSVKRMFFVVKFRQFLPFDVLGTWTSHDGGPQQPGPCSDRSSGQTWLAVRCEREQRFLVVCRKHHAFLFGAWNEQKHVTINWGFLQQLFGSWSVRLHQLFSQRV